MANNTTSGRSDESDAANKGETSRDGGNPRATKSMTATTNTNATKTTANTSRVDASDALLDPDDWHHDATGPPQQPSIPASTPASVATANAEAAPSEVDSLASIVDPPVAEESSEREEDLHRQRYKARHKHHHHHHQHCHRQHQQKHHCQMNHHHQAAAAVAVATTVKGHIKELIKPDPTVRQQRAHHHIIRMSTSRARSPPLVADSSKIIEPPSEDPNAKNTISAAFRTPASSRVAVVVDEEQLQKRFRDSISDKKQNRPQQAANSPSSAPVDNGQHQQQQPKRTPPAPQPPAPAPTTSSTDRRSLRARQASMSQNLKSVSSSSSGSPSRSNSSSHSSSHDADDEIDGMRSPPPTAIIIPPSVAKSLSSRALARPLAAGAATLDAPAQLSAVSAAAAAPSAAITREQLEYGPLLKPGEVQILYRSPDSDSTSLDRHLKEEQAKLVAPNMRQSPIAIMTMNPTYELQNKPLIIEYPARVENLKLNNTGFSWEVKIPYQISMTTALYGAHLNQNHRYRLDQFHCHWGSDNKQGSEHTVDNNHYSAEMHFVHYNMEKYHTMSKAARHPDGLVVLSVFLDARDDHHNHAELEKIVSHLKHVPLKGEHSIIKQAVHIENLLPQNRSYWSYQGSLTTPPYFESVTWFIFKHPIRCNATQIQRFRSLRSALRADLEGHHIDTNHRKTQPLNGRSIVNYDDQSAGGGHSAVLHSSNSRTNSSHLR